MRRLLTGAIVVVAGLALVAGPATATDDTTPDGTTTTTVDPATDPNYDPELGTATITPGLQIPLCGAGTEMDLINNGDDVTCTPSSKPLPDERLVLLDRDADCPVPEDTDYEGYFTESSQMKILIECELGVLEDFFIANIQGVQLPTEWIFVPIGVAGNTHTLGDQFTNGDPFGCDFDGSDLNAFYCVYDGRIYLYEAYVWHEYTTYGDVATIATLAHELGHRIQHSAGIFMWGKSPLHENRATENQADCISGVYLDYVKSLDVFAPKGDDLVDILDGVVAAGQGAEEIGIEKSTHGDVDQRLRAFFTGYLGNDGFHPCNIYTAGFPIVLRTTPAPGSESTTTTTG